MSDPATIRTWWGEHLGASPDPDGSWTLSPAQPANLQGIVGTERTLRLRSFGSDLEARLFSPDGAVDGALVIVPFYDVDSVFGKATARTALSGRGPMANAHGIPLASSGLRVLAVPWWFESAAAADERTSQLPGLEERYGPAAEAHARSLPMTALGRSIADLHLALQAVLDEGLAHPQGVGAFGHSLGGKLSLHLAALDARISAAVAHEPGLGLQHSNWDDPWYLGKQIPTTRDHDELLGLVAPRPFLLAGGGASDGPHNLPLATSAAKRWGEDRGLHLLHHNGGHPLPRHVMAAICLWLVERLQAG